MFRSIVGERPCARKVSPPPPCGEGLGVGVRRRITARPPPRRSAAKLAQAAQACLRAPTLPTRGRGRRSLPLELIPVRTNDLRLHHPPPPATDRVCRAASAH